MNFKSLLLGLFAFVSVAAHADPADLIGPWAYREQACSSGALPNPNLREPVGTVVFTASTMAFSGVHSASCNVLVGPGDITVSANKVTPVNSRIRVEVACADGRKEVNDARFEEFAWAVAGDVLTLTMLPAKYDGETCPKGDSQILRFDRLTR